MIALSTRPDPKGFWFCVNAPLGSHFDLEFVAVGIGGRHSSGEMSGRVSAHEEWRHHDTGFPVIRVGVTAARIVPPSIDETRAVETTRRTAAARRPRSDDDDQSAEPHATRSRVPLGTLDATQLLHEVFPQDQLPTTWPAIASTDDDPYPYPYPYPYPTPSPIR